MLIFFYTTIYIKYIFSECKNIISQFIFHKLYLTSYWSALVFIGITININHTKRNIVLNISYTPNIIYVNPSFTQSNNIRLTIVLNITINKKL